jgi:hypothetical protein
LISVCKNKRAICDLSPSGSFYAPLYSRFASGGIEDPVHGCTAHFGSYLPKFSIISPPRGYVALAKTAGTARYKEGVCQIPPSEIRFFKNVKMG